MGNGWNTPMIRFKDGFFLASAKDKKISFATSGPDLEACICTMLEKFPSTVGMGRVSTGLLTPNVLCE